MSSSSDFAKQVRMSQYYFQILSMLRKYKIPNYVRPILDIAERSPKRIKSTKNIPILFSAN